MNLYFFYADNLRFHNHIHKPLDLDIKKYFIIASILSFTDDRSILCLLLIASTSMFDLNMRHFMEFRLFEPVAYLYLFEPYN